MSWSYMTKHLEFAYIYYLIFSLDLCHRVRVLGTGLPSPVENPAEFWSCSIKDQFWSHLHQDFFFFPLYVWPGKLSSTFWLRVYLWYYCEKWHQFLTYFDLVKSYCCFLEWKIMDLQLVNILHLGTQTDLYLHDGHLHILKYSQRCNTYILQCVLSPLYKIHVNLSLFT